MKGGRSPHPIYSNETLMVIESRERSCYMSCFNLKREAFPEIPNFSFLIPN